MSISKPSTRSVGFTLLELLVVLAIIVALFAILAPAVMSYRYKANVRTAEAQIKVFERALEGFATEKGSYPTSEQGLNALLFIPANEMSPGMMAQPGMMQPGGAMQPGMDPNNMMSGSAVAVGPEMLGGGANPMDPTGGMGAGMGNMANPMDPTGGMGGMAGNMTNPMDPTGGMGAGMTGGMGAGMANPMDPTGGMGGGMMNSMDPTGGMGGMGGGMMGSGWNQPTFNPNLYVNARKRPDPLLPGDSLPKDPWGNDYRYDNTLLPNGNNRYTGTKTPAIWSAGYDKVDNTEDDIRNWDPMVANQQMMLQQQQQNMGGGMNPMDPTGGMGGNMMNPMAPTGGMGGGMMNTTDPTGGMGGGMMTPPTGGGMMTPPAGGGMMTPPTGGGMMAPPAGGTLPPQTPPGM